MKPSEQSEFIKALHDHFPSATASDGEILLKDLVGCDLAKCEAAVEKHRRECGKDAWRPDPARIVAIARGTRSIETLERPIHALRRAAKEQGANELLRLPPSEFVAAWYRRAYKALPGDHQSQARVGIYLACINHLDDAGVDAAASKKIAGEVVEMTAGETIETLVFKTPKIQPLISRSVLKGAIGLELAAISLQPTEGK